jgi:hypothetical protein
MADDRLIEHESELAKAEEQRIQALETQATAMLTVVLAIVAFAASAINKKTLEENTAGIALVFGFLLVTSAFAVAALGPRALKVLAWTRFQPAYRQREQRLSATEERLRQAEVDIDLSPAILDNWRARRSVSGFLAERKALWLTLALMSLLLGFVSSGIVAIATIS